MTILGELVERGRRYSREAIFDHNTVHKYKAPGADIKRQFVRGQRSGHYDHVTGTLLSMLQFLAQGDEKQEAFETRALLVRYLSRIARHSDFAHCECNLPKGFFMDVSSLGENGDKI